MTLLHGRQLHGKLPLLNLPKKKPGAVSRPGAIREFQFQYSAAKMIRQE
jgi:hypothetical protein